MTGQILVSRELIEQVCAEWEQDNDRYMLAKQLRKVLDQPAQASRARVVGFESVQEVDGRVVDRQLTFRGEPTKFTDLRGQIVHHYTLVRQTDHLGVLATKDADIERLAMCEADAGRYRWLRQRVGVDHAYGDFMPWIPTGTSLLTDQEQAETDQAIDAALSAKP